MKPIIAIIMGDPAGIGPEIVAKALSHRDVYALCVPIVVGGRIVKRVIDDGSVDNLYAIGGDTLLGVMNQLGVSKIVPTYEISPGIVLSKIISDKYSFNLISKAGGFGNEEAVSNVISWLLGKS